MQPLGKHPKWSRGGRPDLRRRATRPSAPRWIAAAEAIGAAGCEEPRADAEALVADALGIGIEELSRDGAGELTAGAGG